MADRFKFRVWDKKAKTFIERGLLDIYLGVFSTSNLFNESRFLIEQCTGLKDKNGKLIYEGDILQDCEQKIRVVFDEQRYCFMFEYQNTRAYKPITCIDVLDSELEVIGNIHENKELLK